MPIPLFDAWAHPYVSALFLTFFFGLTSVNSLARTPELSLALVSTLPVNVYSP